MRAPADWVVVSNGIAQRDGNTWRFAATPPISTCVTAVIAGPYHYVHDQHGDLGLYCRRLLQLCSAAEPDAALELANDQVVASPSGSTVGPCSPGSTCGSPRLIAATAATSPATPSRPTRTAPAAEAMDATPRRTRRDAQPHTREHTRTHRWP
ncbi:MAG: hypothetical protein ACRDRK_03750 [Pseudonocardia sp.]